MCNPCNNRNALATATTCLHQRNVLARTTTRLQQPQHAMPAQASAFRKPVISEITITHGAPFCLGVGAWFAGRLFLGQRLPFTLLAEAAFPALTFWLQLPPAQPPSAPTSFGINFFSAQPPSAPASFSLNFLRLQVSSAPFPRVIAGSCGGCFALFFHA